MFDISSLAKLREFTTSVTAAPNQYSLQSNAGLIRHVNRYFSSYNFSALAIDLDTLATDFEVAWLELDWRFANSDGNGTLLKLRYTGLSKYGYIILVRSFVREQGVLIANHDYFILPDELQSRGISRAFNKLLYQTYLRLKVRKIRVHAGLEAGGYVWARVGFSAVNKWEVIGILSQATERILAGTTKVLTHQLIARLHQQVKYFYDNSFGSGRNFPLYVWALDDSYGKDLLLGTSWHGEINFDEPTPVDIFVKYLNKK